MIGENLLDDVLIEILTRLPVKSLLRSKCVCKKWYSIIETPQFIRSHYNHPKNNTRLFVFHSIHHHTSRNYDDDEPINFNEHVMQTSSWGASIFADKTLESYDEIINFKSVYPDYITPQISLVGPVEGLFLVHAHIWSVDEQESDLLALWNPTTAEFMRLPNPNPKPDYINDLMEHHIVAFGFDPLALDYKVALIPNFSSYEFLDHSCSSTISLYTVASRCWRQISDPIVLDSIRDVEWDKYSYNPTNGGWVYLDGKFYWLVTCNESRKQLILLFEMGRDVFRKILLPPEIENHSLSRLHLVDIDGLITVLEIEFLRLKVWSHAMCIHVWVMEEEGCWIKKFSIGNEKNVIGVFRYPIGFWNNNNELLYKISRNEFAVYDVNNMCEIKYFGFRDDISYEADSVVQVFKYKESLVSLNGGEKKKWNRNEFCNVFKDFFESKEKEVANDDDDVKHDDKVLSDLAMARLLL